MSVFKRRRFSTEIILLCVRWYCKYAISYRDLAEMIATNAAFTWIIQQFSAGFSAMRPRSKSGHAGIRVCGRTRDASMRLMFVSVENGTEGPRGAANYLWLAVDNEGRLIDFMLSDRRNTKAATLFLGKALKTMKDWPPSSIATDKLAS
jgi:transposase, IS6 family